MFPGFAVGFVLRPLGGIVLGHIAGRAGRKTALIITIVSMGIATMLIGVLPGYDQIGVAAPPWSLRRAAAVRFRGRVVPVVGVVVLRRPKMLMFGILFGFANSAGDVRRGVVVGV